MVNFLFFFFCFSTFAWGALAVMAGSLFACDGSTLAANLPIGSPFTIDGDVFEAQMVQQDHTVYLLQLSRIHVHDTRRERYKELVQPVQRELWHRESDLIAIQTQIDEVIEQVHHSSSAAEEEDDELGHEFARLCGIRGQHTRRIQQLHSQPMSVSFTETKSQTSVLLSVGTMTLVPWFPTPVFWCPETIVSTVPDITTTQFETVVFPQSSPPPPPRNEIPSIMVIGGWTDVLDDNDNRDCSCIEFHPTRQTWRNAPPLPETRHLHTATFLKEHVYVVGGYNDSMACFDPVTETWTTTEGLGFSIVQAAAVAFGDKIYFMGGAEEQAEVVEIKGDCDEEEEPGRITAAVRVFHVEKKKWQSVAPMLCPRRAHAATVLQDGAIYVTGGGDKEECFASAERYDPVRNEWILLAEMRACRESHASAELDGKLFVLGGQQGDGTVLASVEIYDPKTRKWQPGAPLLEPRYMHTAVTIREKIYVIGGRCDDGTQCTNVECFELATARWTVVAALPPVESHASVWVQ